jgi:hypothetical protein
MDGISSDLVLSRGLENPDLTGNPVPTGLPPKAAALTCRLLSAFLKFPKLENEIPSPAGEMPSDPVLR